MRVKAAAPRRGGPRGAARRAPHRGRRLVDGACWRRAPELYEAFVRGRAPRRCRRWPSSTPTSRCGSAAGCPGSGWRSSSATGAGSWTACPSWTADRPSAARGAGARRGRLRVRAPASDVATGLGRWRASTGATLFMALLAAWIAVLCAGATRTSVVVGHADRRPRPGAARAVDRLLRQHARAARGHGRRSRLRGADPAGARTSRSTPTRTPTCRSSGSSRSLAPAARPLPQPALQVTFQFFNSPTAPDAVAAGAAAGRARDLLVVRPAGGRLPRPVRAWLGASSTTPPSSTSPRCAR